MPLSLLLALASAGEAPIQLQWPVDCAPGRSCFVQNYFDRDPGPGRRDYACGSMTYNGHDGTDIRLPTLKEMRAGVEVRAAAAGTVHNVRDGVADVSVAVAGKAAVQGKECGNGVLIEHPGGWQTQYCHMRRGSVAVRSGRAVKAGERLGLVGLSGDTEFPHLHLSVRLRGEEVDPFAYGAAPGACRSGALLWSPAVRGAVTYASPAVLATGFADGPVTGEAIDAGGAGKALSRGSPAVVAYVRAIGLETGDVQELRLTGPGGKTLAERVLPPLDRAKATYFLFVGSKAGAGAGAWPTGAYTAEYVVRRKGQTALRRRWTTAIAGG
ncbi:MAG TPA: M23 family metallopeptidase [Caulobacteraceae bacterium]|jgi:murein DD-endopeptidase MepM/ murein hydrolase activator NlpD